MNPTPSITAITIVAAQPMDTLAELRRQHSSLLQRDMAGKGTTRPSPGEVLGFLEATSSLGRSLEDLDSREVAQGIMDFWVAQLLSEAPEAAEVSRPFSLEPYDETGAESAASDAREFRVKAAQTAKRANEMIESCAPLEKVKKLPFTRMFNLVPSFLKPFALRIAGAASGTALHRILVRFIRLKENSLEAYSVPVAADDSIFREKGADTVLKQLIESGVVQRHEIVGETPDSYVLAHDSLLTGWTFLNEIVKRRKAFRQLARGWENGGRHQSALLTGGDQLAQALDYPQTDAGEKDFIENCRRASESKQRLLLGWISIGVVILGVLLWLKVKQNSELDAALKLARYRGGELESANQKLTEVNKLEAAERAKVKVINEQLEAATKKLNQANKELIEKTEELTQANNGLNKKTEELTQANKELNEKTQKLTQELALAHNNLSIFKSIKDQIPDLRAHPERISTVLKHLEDTVATLEARRKESDAPNSIGKGMAEIFVLAAVPALVEAAGGLMDALKKEGFQIPAGRPLPRKYVYDQTEVRYFHTEDLPLAKEVEALLLNESKEGRLNGKIVVEDKSMENDNAPKKFIQISIAKNALNPAKK